jgi:hypothetical protein
VETAGTTLVALRGNAVMPATGSTAMFLTAVAEVGMVAFQIPTSTSSWVKHVEEEAVDRSPWLVWARVVCSDEAGEILDESMPIASVVPVHLIYSNRVLQPEKAVNVS